MALDKDALAESLKSAFLGLFGEEDPDEDSASKIEEMSDAVADAIHEYVLGADVSVDVESESGALS